MTSCLYINLLLTLENLWELAGLEYLDAYELLEKVVGLLKALFYTIKCEFYLIWPEDLE